MSVRIADNVSPEAKQDIRELEAKIEKLKNGQIPEEKFAHYRLTRGVYGQRQQVETPKRGIQMFRIKIPFGRITADQLITMADIAEEFTNGNLHTTTRQNIQLHFIKLGDTPEITARLEESGLTAREACGNTVRNITGSAKAGIDPDEAFDISPYAFEMFRYFLRNPICQDMGRKFKPAFSSSEKDSAFCYIHDIGVIPRIKEENGKEIRGFKVLIGGGLGAQPRIADTIYEFLPENQLIPLTEAMLRVFDRHGEREKRFKARMKFLVKKLGLEAFLQLLEEERAALKSKSYVVDRTIVPETVIPATKDFGAVKVVDEKRYQDWLKTNTFEQKQEGFYGVNLTLELGNIQAETARKLAAIVKKYAADDIRITVNQGFLLKFVRPEALPHLFNALDQLGLADAGFDTIADITACPGTDTCNLAVTNSTHLAIELGEVIKDEFYHLIFDQKISIKISGCMNSCGQHMIANVGFHGSSIRNSKLKLIAPAMQIVMSGGLDVDGNGTIAEKVIKVPTKKAPEALRQILQDYEANAQKGEIFNDYYQRVNGKKYFYTLLKPLADLNQLTASDYVDWGQSANFKPEVGVGECAGVSYDVVGGLVLDVEEKLANAKTAISQNAYSEAIYYAYTAFVIGAKALLLSEDVKCNTQIGILKDFDKHFVETEIVQLSSDFQSLVLEINKKEPDEYFAYSYTAAANDFLTKVKAVRQQQIDRDDAQKDKKIIDSFYKA